MRRITVFTYGAMGDFLMLLSLAGALRRAHPDIALTAVATRNDALLRDMAQGQGVKVVNLKNPLSWGGLLNALRSDAVILPPSFGSAPLLFKRLGRLLSWRGTYVGFADKGAAAGFAATLEYRLTDAYYDNMLRALAAAGFALPPQAPAYDAPSVPGALERIGVEPHGYMIIHPFASNPMRSFPPHRWEALIDWLSQRYPEIRLIITCGPAEREMAERLAWGKAQVLAGESVPVLATLLRSTALYIGVDTGMTHLAALVRAPSVVVGNLSNPSWLPRYNERGVILYNDANCSCLGDKTGDCRIVEEGQAYFRCMYDITDQQVTSAIEATAVF